MRARSRSMKYSYMEHCSETVGEQNDCAVKALAIVCNTDYERARSALADAGRQTGEGVYLDQMNEAARLLGFKLIEIEDFIENMLASYPKRYRLKHLTTYQPKRFRQYWLGQPTLLLGCYSHVSAFRDGQIHDWTADVPEFINKVYRVMTISQYNRQFWKAAR